MGVPVFLKHAVFSQDFKAPVNSVSAGQAECLGFDSPPDMVLNLVGVPATIPGACAGMQYWHDFVLTPQRSADLGQGKLLGRINGPGAGMKEALLGRDSMNDPLRR